jgi:hypothetical protein
MLPKRSPQDCIEVNSQHVTMTEREWEISPLIRLNDRRGISNDAGRSRIFLSVFFCLSLNSSPLRHRRTNCVFFCLWYAKIPSGSHPTEMLALICLASLRYGAQENSPAGSKYFSTELTLCDPVSPCLDSFPTPSAHWILYLTWSLICSQMDFFSSISCSARAQPSARMSCSCESSWLSMRRGRSNRDD